MPDETERKRTLYGRLYERFKISIGLPTPTILKPIEEDPSKMGSGPSVAGASTESDGDKARRTLDSAKSILDGRDGLATKKALMAMDIDHNGTVTKEEMAVGIARKANLINSASSQTDFEDIVKSKHMNFAVSALGRSMIASGVSEDAFDSNGAVDINNAVIGITKPGKKDAGPEIG